MTGNPDSGPASSTATWRPASRTICGGARTARPYRHRAFMSRREALVELVHQAPEPVRPESRLGGLAGDLAGRDDRPPPVVQACGRQDDHLGVRPLEQDPPGHPAGLAAYGSGARAVTHGRSLARARRRERTAPPRPPCSSRDAVYRSPAFRLRPAVARLVTGQPR